MRIALTADPELPVPPALYGGIERIIDMLAHGLVARGHEVTVFAHRQSTTVGRVIPWSGHRSGSIADTARNAMQLTREVLRGRFDVIHSFSRIAYLTPVLPLSIPKIMTYQRAITPHAVRFGHALSGGTLSFTAISQWMMRDVAVVGCWEMVPNGVPLDRYDFTSTVADSAPLAFLGRIEEIKGPHLAIDVAKRTSRQLIIAGNIPAEKREWAERNVLQHVDGEQIRYIGTVNDEQKNILLGQAAALLMPILWEEPFGIVMAEALACGTPVLGFRRGAVPEIVRDGLTGFVRDDVDGLVDTIASLRTLSRAACRASVEQLYSQDIIVDRYLTIYSRVVRASEKKRQS